MIRKLNIVYIALLTCVLLVACDFADNRHDQPTGLMVELLRNPEGAVIEDPEPEFSWIANGQEKEFSQMAFQIFVSSTKNKCELDQGDLWDSGKIISPESVNVTYGGEPLKPNTSYFWKVRVWFNNDRPSSYSDIQSFTSGDFKSVHQTSVMPLVREQIKPLLLKQKSTATILSISGKLPLGTCGFKLRAIGSIRLFSTWAKNWVPPTPLTEIREGRSGIAALRCR